MPGEDLPQEVGTVVLQLVMMLAMLAEVVTATTATAAAMAAAGGCVARRCDGRDHGDGQSQDGAKTSRWPPLRYWLDVMGRMRHGTAASDGVEMEKTRPGEYDRAGPFITICLHVRVGGVADVDVAMEPRAPHPAGRIAAEVDGGGVPVVAVVVMAVVVMAVVVMAVMAVMAMTMAMTATVPAAGVRVSGGRKRGDRQRDSGDSGSEDGTLHSNFSWVYARATIALGDAY